MNEPSPPTPTLCCKRCSRVLPRTEFYGNSSWACRRCAVLYQTEYNTLNRRRRQAATYGLTLDEVERMRESQGNACALCRVSFEMKAFSIDHDHAVGHVRGLLCTKCNAALGAFGDDPARLEAAAHYLRAAKFVSV